MRAIFIGGPLHGETKQVEPGHTRCAFHQPPRGFSNGGDSEFDAEVVTYQRRLSFGDTAIFTPSEEGTDDASKLIVESIERGLQLSPEPPLRDVVSMIFRLRMSSYLFGPAEDDAKNIDFVTDFIRQRWKRQQDFKSRK